MLNLFSNQASSPTFRDKYSLYLNNVAGNAQYADGGNAAALDFEGTDPMWMGAWVYVEQYQDPSVQQLGKMEIMGKVYDSGGTAIGSETDVKQHVGYHMRVWTDCQSSLPYYGRLCFYIVSKFYQHTNLYMGITSPDGAVQLRTWVHCMVASLDGTAANAKMWINFNPVTPVIESDTLSGSIKTDSIFSLGSRNGAENYFWGKINDPFIAKFFPTNADIAAIKGRSPNPQDITRASLSGSLKSAWFTGDKDNLSGTTIKDQVGSVDLTLRNGASFIKDSQSSVQPSAVVGWTPTSSMTGTLDTWVDATDNTKITTPGGLIRIQSKGATYTGTWTANNGGITLSTLNGLQCLKNDGTGYLLQDTARRLMAITDKFVLAIACQIQSYQSNPIYPGVILDGDNVGQCTKIGFSNDSVNGYTDFIFGANSGFHPFRWQIGSAQSPPAVDDFSAPKAVTAVFEYNGVNGPNGFIATFNNITQFTLTANGDSSQIAAGRLMALDNTDTLNGKLGEIVLIKNPSYQDVLNLKLYMRTRWG